MKKIVKRIFLVLLAVVTVYTAVATVLIHGVSVYRMNSQLGAVLAVSRQVTFLAAIILWIVAVILIWRWSSARRKKGKMTEAAADTSAALSPKGAKKKPKKLFGKPAAAEKIPPKGATMPMPDNGAEKIPPKRGTMPMPAEKPAEPSTGPTMPMPIEKPAGTAAGPTMPMPKEKSPVLSDTASDFENNSWTIGGKTLREEIPARPVVNEPKPKQPTSGVICPKCGSMVRAGAKFCTKCGCRLEAGV
ncbi:zinc ribbon domain-containing protein [uncultured Gemmiger sp.]|uniref:zinc ribbon domain-containing protein n=1 Tax=uncultured Gemmiger sp. TaxID=1623490 RepID=UPI0025E7EB98|nr:zinc-ribbon domain-containing protein [uncultured Gemmiger sp.]